ncbi:MAG: ribosome silencing factor [Deltaproteobacteria bacterium]|nr:ribosome silencing factor [Deltaproteobacteria bacterium]
MRTAVPVSKTSAGAVEPRLALIAGVVEEMKGEALTILDLRSLTSFTDFFLLCSGTSDRHVQSIGETIVTRLKSHGIMPLGVEGHDSAQWILIDYGAIVVHVFYPAAREFYQIEKFWADAPVISL